MEQICVISDFVPFSLFVCYCSYLFNPPPRPNYPPAWGIQTMSYMLVTQHLSPLLGMGRLAASLLSEKLWREASKLACVSLYLGFSVQVSTSMSGTHCDCRGLTKCHSVLTLGVLGYQFCGGTKGTRSAPEATEEMGSLLLGSFLLLLFGFCKVTDLGPFSPSYPAFWEGGSYEYILNCPLKDLSR